VYPSIYGFRCVAGYWEIEPDGRWITEIVDVPGILAYGATEKEAIAAAQALALRVLADRIEQQK
jgi:predicted RNase H-like HicB family nuclease